MATGDWLIFQGTCQVPATIQSIFYLIYSSWQQKRSHCHALFYATLSIPTHPLLHIMLMFLIIVSYFSQLLKSTKLFTLFLFHHFTWNILKVTPYRFTVCSSIIYLTSFLYKQVRHLFSLCYETINNSTVNQIIHINFVNSKIILVYRNKITAS